MRTTILFIFLIASIAQQVFGQEKCDDGLALNEYDKIKELKALQTKLVSYSLSLRNNHTIGIELKDRELNLLSTSTQFDVNKNNTEIGFIMEDGSTMLFKFDKPAMVEKLPMENIYVNRVGLSVKNLMKLASTPIKTVRQYGTGKVIDFKDKKAVKFMQYSKCFLSQIDTLEDIGVDSDELEVKISPKDDKITAIVVDKVKVEQEKKLAYTAKVKDSSNVIKLLEGQKLIEIKVPATISISEKHGSTIINEKTTLQIVTSKSIFSYRSHENQNMAICTIRKEIDTYIISDINGNYHFYDKKNRRLYTMDYFIGRYIVGGYGAGYSKVKAETEIIMKMLKDGKTQKDVIQHLIKQTEYDY
jgi:hypothetical protein